MFHTTNTRFKHLHTADDILIIKYFLNSIIIDEDWRIDKSHHKTWAVNGQFPISPRYLLRHKRAWRVDKTCRVVFEIRRLIEVEVSEIYSPIANVLSGDLLQVHNSNRMPPTSEACPSHAQPPPTRETFSRRYVTLPGWWVVGIIEFVVARWPIFTEWPQH